MKTLKLLGMVLLSTVMTLSMVACGSDSDDDNGGSHDWQGNYLVMASSDFVNYPIQIQVLSLKTDGRFYSTHYYTEDGKLVGGSCAYGALTVNEGKKTMTMNGVTMNYSVDGNAINFYSNGTTTTYYRLNAEQEKVFNDLAKKAQGYVIPYEITSGTGTIIPGDGGSGPGSGSGSNKIVGKWYDYYSEDGYIWYGIWDFGSNGILTQYSLSSQGGKVWYKKVEGAYPYKVSGNQLTITGEGTTKFVISGNTLILDDDPLQKVTADIQKIFDSATSI